MPTALNFASSLYLGTEGQYNIGGIDVFFKKEIPPDNPTMQEAVKEVFAHLKNWMFKKPPTFMEQAKERVYAWLKHEAVQSAFNGMLMIPCYSFVHEMGHALAMKYLRGTKPRVVIVPIDFTKDSQKAGYASDFPPLWKFLILGRSCIPKSKAHIDSLISAAGPLTSALFSVCQMVVAIALKTFCAPLSYFIAVLAVSNLLSEEIYAVMSLVEGRGDFAKIRENNLGHLLLALAALVVIAVSGNCLFMSHFR